MVEIAARPTDIVAEVTSWLEENWDPDITVREWWNASDAGWSAPTLPAEWWGKGAFRARKASA